MQIVATRNPVTSNLNHVQTFSIANLTKLFKTFSNIYSDPVRAVVRELICNAIDASPDPVTIVAPSALNPYLTISDTGPGMDPEFMLTRYTEVGFSTKDGDNDAIGGFGWGRLSALALCDTYTVTTQGRVYVLAKDEFGIPRISEAGATDETGTHIRVPIPNEQRNLTRQRLQEFLQWLPVERYRVVGVEVTPIKALYEDEHCLVRPQNTTSYNQKFGVLMGPVFYELDPDKANLPRELVINPMVVLKLPIGAVELPPNRESISYGPLTTQYLFKAYTEIREPLIAAIRAHVEALSPWQRLDAVKGLSGLYGLVKDNRLFPEHHREFVLPTVASVYSPSHRAKHNLSPRPEIYDPFRLTVYHRLGGAEYYLNDVPDRVYERIRDRPTSCVVLRPCPWLPDAAAFEKYLERPVKLLSSLPTAPRVSAPKSAPLIYDQAGAATTYFPDGAVWWHKDEEPPRGPRPEKWFQLGKMAQGAYLNSTHERLDDWQARQLRETLEDPQLKLYLQARWVSIPYWWRNFLSRNPDAFPEATDELRELELICNYPRSQYLNYIDLPEVKPLKVPHISKVMRTKKRLDAFLRAGENQSKPDDFKLFI